MSAATSSISRLSPSSASRAATSAANSERFRRRPALSRIARRTASDLLRPVASSCASACKASRSRRTLITEDTPQVYYELSYRRGRTRQGHAGARRTDSGAASQWPANGMQPQSWRARDLGSQGSDPVVARRLSAERVTRIELALSAWESGETLMSVAMSCAYRCPRVTVIARRSPGLMAR